MAYEDAAAELALFEGGVFEAGYFLHQVKKRPVKTTKTELTGMLDIDLELWQVFSIKITDMGHRDTR